MLSLEVIRLQFLGWWWYAGHRPLMELGGCALAEVGKLVTHGLGLVSHAEVAALGHWGLSGDYVMVLESGLDREVVIGGRGLAYAEYGAFSSGLPR